VAREWNGINFYRGEEGMNWGIKCLPRFYKMMKFRNGEKGKVLWEEEWRRMRRD
jgi:hypothetical protein